MPLSIPASATIPLPWVFHATLSSKVIVLPWMLSPAFKSHKSSGNFSGILLQLHAIKTVERAIPPPD
ncbi:MAG: hypothetical protein LBS95_00515 [Mycoplasmataceae bacterium]|nr:hypothetical protein [Mycoplasmataceae bacterium]